ncbi:hypothetical protein D3C86_1367610 [compost metagenome]
MLVRFRALITLARMALRAWDAMRPGCCSLTSETSLSRCSVVSTSRISPAKAAKASILPLCSASMEAMKALRAAVSRVGAFMRAWRFCHLACISSLL